ncbi:unnamed protein product [Amaranthus hypochondriacus]
MEPAITIFTIIICVMFGLAFAIAILRRCCYGSQALSDQGTTNQSMDTHHHAHHHAMAAHHHAHDHAMAAHHHAMAAHH